MGAPEKSAVHVRTHAATVRRLRAPFCSLATAARAFHDNGGGSSDGGRYADLRATTKTT